MHMEGGIFDYRENMRNREDHFALTGLGCAS